MGGERRSLKQVGGEGRRGGEEGGVSRCIGKEGRSQEGNGRTVDPEPDRTSGQE